MPTWLNIALTSFYMVWLVAVLVFLCIIWRNGAKHAQKLEMALIDAMRATAEAAQKAAEASRLLACQKTVQGSATTAPAHHQALLEKEKEEKEEKGEVPLQ